MAKLSKRELMDQIKSIFNYAQNKINNLIEENEFIFFGVDTFKDIKSVRENDDWVTESHETFFTHFNQLKTTQNLTLYIISRIIDDERSDYCTDTLDNHFISKEEKEEYIKEFDNTSQERIKKQKILNELLKQIESKKVELRNLKDKYNELGGQYVV